MFKDRTKRFLTKAISKTIPLEIQILLWNLIDQQIKRGTELDYLQVFELRSKDDKKEIIHRQEVPPSKSRWIGTLKSTNPIDSVVWCIDDGENQMMLYSSDY